MNIIRLDHKALAHFLASEGEEFRIELRNAILDTAIKNTYGHVFNSEVKGLIESAIREEVHKWLEDNVGKIVNVRFKDKVQLNDKFKTEIAEEMKRSVHSYVDNITAKPHIKLMVDKRLDEISAIVSGTLNQEIRREVREQVKTMVSNIVAEVAHLE